MKTARILVLSPYDISSHQYWWQGMCEHLPEYEWEVLTLPPRYFAWRMRGNSLSWAYEQADTLKQDYDLLIACSLTDLSSLRGFIPSLAKIPCVVYCHENQFAFPANPDTQHQGETERQIIQLYNFQCADQVIFNSAFNRKTCLEGAAKLLKKLPDHVPGKFIKNIEDKSSVLPVPLTPITSTAARQYQEKQNSFSIVWNHRWEYDKGLILLEHITRLLIEHQVIHTMHVVGQSFRKIPPPMQNTLALLKENHLLGKSGFIESKNEYHTLLEQSDLVLSTAEHEFQGLAIMEAVQRNCTPVLPARLSYPEFFPEEFLFESHTNKEQEAKHCVERISDLKVKGLLHFAATLENTKDNLPSWDNKKAAYQNLINSFL